MAEDLVRKLEAEVQHESTASTYAVLVVKRARGRESGTARESASARIRKSQTQRERETEREDPSPVFCQLDTTFDNLQDRPARLL